MHFYYTKLTCIYGININNDYFSIDFVAFQGGGKRPPSEIQGDGKVRGQLSKGS